MTDKEALKMALEALKTIDEAMPFPVAKLAQAAIKEALAQPVQEPVRLQCVKCGTVYADGVPPQVAQPEERNFCPRCGKRTADPTTIHTCTPPRENT